MLGNILDVKGIKVGQAEDEAARTGVTVIRCDRGGVGGVDVRGAAPGTRETDLLRPDCTVDQVHAIALCGGSAFGLDAAGGVMAQLESEGIGLPVAGVARVPIVCAAVLFDLACGRADIRPDAAMGRLAASRAGEAFRQGPYGAGCGATVGKLVPGVTPGRGGVGSASIRLPNGMTVAALVAVNAAGDIYDDTTGAWVAGGMLAGKPVPAEALILQAGEMNQPLLANANTTLAVVATDARLTKPQANRLATCAHDGLARSIRPVHTVSDGDTAFALATGEVAQAVEMADMVMLCAAAAAVTAQAVVRAVSQK